MRGRVKVQQLTVVILPLLPLEFRRRQLSPIRLWIRRFLRSLYTAKRQYENYSCPGLLFTLITSNFATAICQSLTLATQLESPFMCPLISNMCLSSCWLSLTMLQQLLRASICSWQLYLCCHFIAFISGMKALNAHSHNTLTSRKQTCKIQSDLD